VVVTGNHYWLDAIAAAALVALVVTVVTPLSRPAAAPVRTHEIPSVPPFAGLGVLRPALPEQRHKAPALPAYARKNPPRAGGSRSRTSA
jgi:hypothetical protein